MCDEDTQLLEDGRHVGLGRGFDDVELVSDLPIRHALTDQAQHLELTGRQVHALQAFQTLGVWAMEQLEMTKAALTRPSRVPAFTGLCLVAGARFELATFGL